MSDLDGRHLETYLPAHLRSPTTTITRMAAGLSGAGVYRVEAGGETFALKIASPQTDADDWRRHVEIQQAAAAAGVAPRVVHVDARQQAVLTAFVTDRSFPMLLITPSTRAQAITLLGTTLAAVHGLPVPPGMPAADPLGHLTRLYRNLDGAALASFHREAIEAVLSEPEPPSDRAAVLCHNDANPSNLAYDGDRLVLLDWDAAAPGDPLFDLAAIAVFFRMNKQTCVQLVAAHDGAPPAPLPARFLHDRRLVGILCGTAFIDLAHRGGHTGGAEDTIEATISLADVHQRLRSSSLSISSPAGQWTFGLALVKHALSPLA